MPEQYSKDTMVDKAFYKHFFDTGKKLKAAGVSVRKSGEHFTGESGVKSKVVQLDQNFKVRVCVLVRVLRAADTVHSECQACSSRGRELCNAGVGV